ncbi:MAG: glycosyltransferase family 4 protein [Paludibacter sp.]|nr:glycosyltransferase family 4 protein [Paludibacter sp.]
MIDVLTPIRPGGPYNWGRDLVNLLNEKGYEARHLHSIEKLVIAPFRNDSSIVHSSVPFFLFRNKPLIMTIKGDYSREKNTWRVFYPASIKRADVVTTPSLYLKETLNLKDAVIIPNAIRVDRYRTVQHKDKETINLVTVSAFHFKEKTEGILCILSIIKSLPNDIQKRVRYTIVGDGPYLAKIKEETRKLNLQVNFLGFLPDTKPVLEESDVFLYYSLYDNFPNVILEAMASALPVVTNSVGAVNEIINNQVDGFVSLDNEEFTSSLLRLIEDSELRRKIGMEARKTTENKFNWDVIIDRYLAIYKNFLSKRDN